MRKLRKIFLALLFVSQASPVFAQAAKDAPPPPPTGPATSVVVPAQAPSPRDNSVASSEAIENPYGLEALWKRGDFVARGTLIILVIMSMGTWYIVIVKYIRAGASLPPGSARPMPSSGRPSTSPKARRHCKEGSAFRFIAESGIERGQAPRGQARSEQIDLNTWVTMSLQRAMDDVTTRLQDGLAFLATVGSTAPFVGLFGTVWGIYHALTAIGIAGQASIDKVAGPVGEALIMTASASPSRCPRCSATTGSCAATRSRSSTCAPSAQTCTWC